MCDILYTKSNIIYGIFLSCNYSIRDTRNLNLNIRYIVSLVAILNCFIQSIIWVYHVSVGFVLFMSKALVAWNDPFVTFFFEFEWHIFSTKHRHLYENKLCPSHCRSISSLTSIGNCRRVPIMGLEKLTLPERMISFPDLVYCLFVLFTYIFLPLCFFCMLNNLFVII